MFKIQRSSNGEVVFTITGRIREENVPELKALFASEEEGRRVVLDLNDLTLLDRGALRFFKHCEAGGIVLKNCPAYIREWIKREQSEG